MMDLECPNCGEIFEMEEVFWNTKTICPHCFVELYVDYDFTPLEDGDEWPHWFVSVIKR